MHQLKDKWLSICKHICSIFQMQCFWSCSLLPLSILLNRMYCFTGKFGESIYGEKFPGESWWITQCDFVSLDGCILIKILKLALLIAWNKLVVELFSFIILLVEDWISPFFFLVFNICMCIPIYLLSHKSNVSWEQMDFLFALPVKVGMTMILFLLHGSIGLMNLDIVYLSLKMVGCMVILPNCVQPINFVVLLQVYIMYLMNVRLVFALGLYLLVDLVPLVFSLKY